MIEHYSRSRFAAVLGCCVSVSGPVWAQSATEREAEPSLEEVVVTANRREENLQKASVAVTAISSETIKALGITSALDISKVVPNLTVSQMGVGAAVAMRGVVSLNQTEVGNPAVTYAVDGVDFARQRAALSGMFDVERIEVLRGPQGTLYGRNSTAGSINVVTKKPDLDKVSYSASLGYGNYGALSTNAAVNLPLSDTFGFRAALNTEKHDGYTDISPNPRKRFNDRNFKAGRVHLLWRPVDSFSALFTYDIADGGGAGQAGNGVGATTGLYPASMGATPYKYQVMPAVPFHDNRVNSGTLTLNWELPWFDVTYLGNRREDDWTQSVPQGIYGPLSSICQNQQSLNCFNPLTTQSHDEQTSHELRFAKNIDSFNWVVGLFHFEENNEVTASQSPNNAGRAQLSYVPNVFDGSKAVFGQGTWNITDRLRLIGGARYTEDHKSRIGYVYTGAPGAVTNLQCPSCTLLSTNLADVSFNKVTWRAGVDFDLGSDSLLFASIATGYKAGGYGDGVQPNNGPYGPENVTNYELGWKSQLFNRRMTLNVDAYLMKYKDYQATAGSVQVVGNQTQNVLVTINAGKADIKGIEVESTYLLTPYDRLSLNVTYLDTEFTDFVLPTGDAYSPGGASFRPYSLAGNELPYAPKNTVGLRYDHTFELGTLGSLVASVDSGYTAHQYLDFHNFDAVAQDSYTRTGASLMWDFNERFSTQLYVRNIEDKAIIAAMQPDARSPGRDFDNYGREVLYMAPRTYGVRFSASF
jgi:iron complex outermembrane receptor protein